MGNSTTGRGREPPAAQGQSRNPAEQLRGDLVIVRGVPGAEERLRRGLQVLLDVIDQAERKPSAM